MASTDRVFLDANVMFSAAWRETSGLRRLWELPGIALVTSVYAAEEARVNLPTEEQRSRLATLLERVSVESGASAVLLAEIALVEKDRPILAAAVAAGAKYLLTGDVTHFGRYLGSAVLRVVILRPADFLRLRAR